MGQDYAIVAVKDARDQDYLREICKYVCKGSDLAAWSGPDIASFIDSFTGVRTFSTFGTMFRRCKAVKALLADLSSSGPECPKCSSTHLRYLSSNEEEWLHTTGQFPV
jgi:hypothetical protein